MKSTIYAKLTSYFLPLMLIVIFVIPALLLVLYANLAGGLLNGFAGSRHRASVNPDILVLGVNPIVTIILQQTTP